MINDDTCLHLGWVLSYVVYRIIVYIQVYQAGMILYVDFDDRVRRFLIVLPAPPSFVDIETQGCFSLNIAWLQTQIMICDCRHLTSGKSSTWVHFRVIPHPRNSELLNKGISSKYLGTDQNQFFSL